MIKKLIQVLEESDKSSVNISKVRYNIDGTPIPSVTQIIGKCISEEYLMGWANYLGFKRIKYKDQVGLAATIGTDGHNAIESYLSTNAESDNMCYLSFRVWWDMLTSTHVVKILGMEEELILPYCAGTYDLLLDIDGRIFLIDFKTSNHVSYKHFIQLAAYRHMLYKVKNINIDGCLILQVDKETPSFEEFALDFANAEHYSFIEHCAFTFVSLALSFYSINKAEGMFKQIF